MTMAQNTKPRGWGCALARLNQLPVQTCLFLIVSLGTLAFLFQTGKGTAAFEPWYLTLFVPLYSRVTRDQVEEDIKQDTTRGHVFSYIKDNPGSSFTTIKDACSMGNGQTAYHLQVLEREEFVCSVKEGVRRKFYIVNARPRIRRYPNDNALNRTKKQIIALLYERPGLTLTKIGEHIKMTPQSASYNIAELERLEIVKTRFFGFRKLCSLDPYYLEHLLRPQTRGSLMKKCPECQTELPLSFTFCSQCGKRLEETESGEAKKAENREMPGKNGPLGHGISRKKTRRETRGARPLEQGL